MAGCAPSSQAPRPSIPSSPSWNPPRKNGPMAPGPGTARQHIRQRKDDCHEFPDGQGSPTHHHAGTHRQEPVSGTSVFRSHRCGRSHVQHPHVSHRKHHHSTGHHLPRCLHRQLSSCSLVSQVLPLSRPNILESRQPSSRHDHPHRHAPV